MSLERDISKILDELGESRRDAWGDESRIVARGIRDSGLIEEVRISGARSEAGLFSLAIALGASTRVITQALATSNGLLGEIDSLLRNPQAATADEYYRRGVKALENSWIPEAIDDLSNSVRTNPYFPQAHIYLGLSLDRAGDRQGALDAFERGFKYALPDSAQVAVGALLLVASTWLDLGRRVDARDAMTPHLEAFAECPEFLILLSRTGDDDSGLLDQAFRLAPELAVGAVISGVHGAEAAATRVAHEDGSNVARARQFVTALATLASSVQEVAPLRLIEIETKLSSGSPAAVLGSAAEVLSAAPDIVLQARAHLTPEMMERSPIEPDYSEWPYDDQQVPLTLRAVKESRGRALDVMERIAAWPSRRLRPWQSNWRPAE
jgi:hypothetical protein